MEAAIPRAASYHMDGSDFRRLGYELIDLIADYHDRVGDLSVGPNVIPGEVAAKLSKTPPEHGDRLTSLTQDLEGIIIPGLTHWQSPRFHGFYPANATGPAILGELLSAGFGVNGMLWMTSPAVTELETRVMDWLVDLCGLDERFHSELSGGRGGGVILDSASSAFLTAVVAARHRAVGHRPAPELVVYASTQAHSSVQKGLRVAGFADHQLRSIDVDDKFAMRPDLLSQAIEFDVAAGNRPFMVVATSGTTSSCAFDPVPELVAIARDYDMKSADGFSDIWVHVDGAFAGSAAVAPELRFVNSGLELVDSYCFNPHKWLLTNFDATAFFVADRGALTSAMSIVPEYLRNEASDSGSVIDYRDWQVPLGRRFRALKLWMVIRWYGAEGLRAHIRGHVALSKELAAKVAEHPRFELAAPTELAVVCFVHTEGDVTSKAILEAINADKRHHLTQTLLNGRYIIRVAIGSVKTGREHVEELWRDVCAIESSLAGGSQ